MDTRIKEIKARQILDCKSRPAVEVDVVTQDGARGRFAAPTGTSVGSHESFILRDHDPDDYEGLSVHKAVAKVNDVIAPELIGMDACDQKSIDEQMLKLDGTSDKHVLGGNSIYSVSGACLRAAADAHRVPIHHYIAGGNLKRVPMLTFNIVNGGKNSNGITQGCNEFMIVPYKADTEDEVVKMGVAVFRRLGKIITKWQNGTPAVHGGSYGWAAPSNDPAVIMDLIAAAVEDCGYTDRFAYAMDYASSEFFNPTDGTYELCGERVTHDAMIEKAKEIITKHPMVFIEDLCSEDDWEGFVKAHKVLTRTNIIGDDFLVTNIERIKKAKEMDAVDGFIFKPNQIGTVTEAFAAVDYAESQGMFFVPSGRAGGAIQDLVVDMGIGRHALLAKNGSPWSGERLDSLNTYLRASNDLREIPVADISGIVKF